LITPQEFADQYLGQYKIKGEEMNFKHCPFCGPNRKSDNQYKFYMNMETGAYKCYREKHCGVEGGFLDIKQKYNVVDDDYKPRKRKKEYKKPSSDTIELQSKKVIEYIQKRKISIDTAKNHNVKEKNGNIAFEYYQNGERVLIKYRTASKDKSYWQDGGGKPVLWDIDNVDTSKELIITEGEFDKLAINEAGIDNVVSVPFGASNLEWIDENYDTLQEIDNIVLWTDNDEAGEKMKKKLLKRLGRDRCMVVDTKYKDANIALYKEGKEKIKEIIDNAELVPVQRLIDVKDIEEFDPTEIESIKSNIPLINKYIGGYMMGAVTIWTGINGSGKSTILNQEVLQAVDEYFGTVLLTGELPNWLTRYWLELQAAGPKYVKSKYDEVREKESYYVGKEEKEKIRDWLSGNMLRIYDSIESLKVDDIKETFLDAAKRYGIKNFVVDNLMIVNYESSYKEKFNKQSEFIQAMKDFAKNYNVHVHIVAHPRKPKETLITKHDISGLSDITNRVDNVIGIHRVTDKNRKALGLNEDTQVQNILEIFKNRIYGMQDIRIKLDFDVKSKRFKQMGIDKVKKYGWEELK